MQNCHAESFNGRMRHELLNETLFLSINHARGGIAVWVGDYNRERPLSPLGHTAPEAFVVELDKQWPASPNPTGSTAQAIVSTALMRKATARLNPSWRQAGGRGRVYFEHARSYLSMSHPSRSVLADILERLRPQIHVSQ